MTETNKPILTDFTKVEYNKTKLRGVVVASTDLNDVNFVDGTSMKFDELDSEEKRQICDFITFLNEYGKLK